MRKRNFRVLPGGDYGFAWNPHGDYAKELDFFVKYVGLDALEVLKCATKTGGEILGRGDEIGTLETGKLADVLVVDGDVVPSGTPAAPLPVESGWKGSTVSTANQTPSIA